MGRKRRLSVGDRIGILTLLQRIRVRGVPLRWECRCDCGQVKLIFSKKLTKKCPVKSCGCRFIAFTKPRSLEECYEVADNGCWNWLGNLHGGYGRRRGKNAHRAVYEELVGPIAADHDIHHLCRNKKCVNPEHLTPVLEGEHQRLHNPVQVGVSIHRCPKGHAFTPDNIVIRKRKRDCRACRNAAARLYWHTHDRKNPKVRKALKLSSRVTLER